MGREHRTPFPLISSLVGTCFYFLRHSLVYNAIVVIGFLFLLLVCTFFLHRVRLSVINEELELDREIEHHRSYDRRTNRVEPIGLHHGHPSNLRRQKSILNVDFDIDCRENDMHGEGFGDGGCGLVEKTYSDDFVDEVLVHNTANVKRSNISERANDDLSCLILSSAKATDRNVGSEVEVVTRHASSSDIQSVEKIRTRNDAAADSLHVSLEAARSLAHDDLVDRMKTRVVPKELSLTADVRECELIDSVLTSQINTELSTNNVSISDRDDAHIERAAALEKSFQCAQSTLDHAFQMEQDQAKVKLAERLAKDKEMNKKRRLSVAKIKLRSIAEQVVVKVKVSQAFKSALD